MSRIRKVILSVICIMFCVSGLMAQAQKDTVFSVSTANTEVVILVKNGIAYLNTYGSKLESNDILLSEKMINRRGGAEVKMIASGEIYPSYGRGNTNEAALIATHVDGNLTTELIYKGADFVEIDKNVHQTTIHLSDNYYDFNVTLFFNAYQKEDVIEQWVEIENNENGGVKLEKYSSTFLNFLRDDYYITHFYGAWSSEKRMVEEQLIRGIKTIEAKRGVRATQMENPEVILSKGAPAQEYVGECYGIALAWSGNYKFNFDIDNTLKLRITAGISPYLSDYVLEKGEKLTTPKAILTYSNAGKSLMSRNMHQWARKYALQDGDEERPMLINNWTGTYFDFDEPMIKGMIDDAAAMGLEMFVLDDGWFGTDFPRDNDKQGLGDWELNKNKLPNGLNYLAKYANEQGIKFGIWVEPEMVNPKSNLAQDHPDWIVQSKHREPMLQRNQLLLDLTNPEVVDFVFGVVDGVLSENPNIEYVKWDANRHVENLGSTYLSADKQSHFFVDYVQNLYTIYEKLNEKYPDVIFQACASGGGRVDYGIMKYNHEFWPSDNIGPSDRLLIQWSNSQFYPAIAIASHVGSSPNHQTNRSTPIKYRCDVAMSGRMGYELIPAHMTDEEKKFSMRAIKTYKQIRPIVQFGDLYRFNSPYDNDGYTALSYVSASKDEAVAFAYSTELHLREIYYQMKFKGIDPDANYKVSEINKAKKKFFLNDDAIYSGKFLIERGIQLKIAGCYDSVVLELKKQ